jgi:nitronate monooxygenase
MMKTRITELLGIEHPILSAGMGVVAMARLAAAVSEAGGMGTIGLAAMDPAAARAEIRTAGDLTSRPFGVNLLIPFLEPGLIEAAIEERPAAATFFWGEPDDFRDAIRRLKDAGTKVLWQCGSAAEARAAAKAGVDAIIAQGLDAGGHVRGIVTTLALIPEVRDAIGDLPMAAAGGIADGRGLAAVLALGADGAAIGTRFAASAESAAHPLYKERLVRGHASETIHTTLYDIGWPDAAHRVLRTSVVEEWERAGRPASGSRPGEGAPAGQIRRRDGSAAPLVRYSVIPPAEYMEGDVEGLAYYAGNSVSLVREIFPAGEIVRRIVAEAEEVIAKRLAPLVR